MNIHSTLAMPKSQQKYEEVRSRTTNQILGAASRVFSKRGMTATISDIATEAGVSQGLAYRYFASKEEIFYALLRQVIQSGGVINRHAKSQGDTVWQSLELIVSDIIRQRQEHPEFSKLVFQTIFDERLPLDIREMLDKQGRGARRIMHQLIVQGQAKGEIAKDDPNLLVDALFACIEGLSRKMASVGPGVRVELPNPKIIMRMLKPDLV